MLATGKVKRASTGVILKASSLEKSDGGMRMFAGNFLAAILMYSFMDKKHRIILDDAK